MKGIVLAGGLGTRLYPLTIATTKQLLPIYDKPMIYYPLSILMISGIRDIILIVDKNDLKCFKELLGNGENFGIKIKYLVQDQPNGIAESFLIAKKYIKNQRVCLILGDNIFYGQGLKYKLDKAKKRTKGATIFSYKVANPSDFGVVQYDQHNKVISIEEKPKKPKSSEAVTGLYFYDRNIIEFAESIKPSKRNELEITDINKLYLQKNLLFVEDFGRGFAWLDTGTKESILEASLFIQTIEKRQNLKVACLEEIACRSGWISPLKVKKIGEKLKQTEYGEYLINIAKDLSKN